MEICLAIFAKVLELDEDGIPMNEKYSERRAATWLYKYCTGDFPPGEAPGSVGVRTLLTALSGHAESSV